jgi:hypothetical protein
LPDIPDRSFYRKSSETIQTLYRNRSETIQTYCAAKRLIKILRRADTAKDLNENTDQGGGSIRRLNTLGVPCTTGNTRVQVLPVEDRSFSENIIIILPNTIIN